MITDGCMLQGCPGPLEITEIYTLESTSGPVRHMKARCLHGHIFDMPERLDIQVRSES